MQKWMDSVPGQTFLNYAYSWGAAIVILGTLFKLTHLPGANIMLFLGMGTEVVVFFLSAFDRPFDKTAIGRELAIHNNEEEVDETEPAETVAADVEETQTPAQPGMAAAVPGTIIIGGSNTAPAIGTEPTEGTIPAVGAPAAGGMAIGSPAWVTQQAEAKSTSKANASHATAKRWKTSTAHSPALPKSMRCSLRVPANRLVPSTKSTNRHNAWHNRYKSLTAFMHA